MVSLVHIISSTRKRGGYAHEYALGEALTTQIAWQNSPTALLMGAGNFASFLRRKRRDLQSQNPHGRRPQDLRGIVRPEDTPQTN